MVKHHIKRDKRLDSALRIGGQKKNMNLNVTVFLNIVTVSCHRFTHVVVFVHHTYSEARKHTHVCVHVFTYICAYK